MNQRRKRPQRLVSGWLVFDKPYGMGSTDAVSLIKRTFRADKAGHAGTLDPLATGVLPIALGEATKTVPYLMDERKTYVFNVTWGEERTTDDLEGEVTQRSDKRPSQADLLALIPRFTGTISQVPPQFSAVKINGARAYDLAREGEAVDIAAREVEVFRLELLACPDADTTRFEVECGKGTYVRAFARDMGRLLGCYGHVSELRRISVAPFDERLAVTQEQLAEAARQVSAALEAQPDLNPLSGEAFRPLDALLKSPESALAALPHIALNDEAAQRVRLGNPAIVRGHDAPVEAAAAYATSKGRLLSIGEVRFGEFHPRRVFNQH
jgi:tRNA pseudouridine55 synthase